MGRAPDSSKTGNTSARISMNSSGPGHITLTLCGESLRRNCHDLDQSARHCFRSRDRIEREELIPMTECENAITCEPAMTQKPAEEFVDAIPQQPMSTPGHARTRLPARGSCLNPQTIVLVVWGVAVATGFGIIERYSQDAGESASPPHSWPETSGISRHTDRPLMLVFIHPRCPCSRATLRELERILCAAGDRRPDVRILALVPHEAPRGWEQTDLWTSAASIPGASTLVDRNGKEARRFGVSTSGTVVLYDRRAKLAFHGGITPRRGHEGRSAGHGALFALLMRRTQQVDETPVFGCPL